MTFNFHKGTHRARPFYWLAWFPVLFRKVIKRQVCFDFSCKYELPGGDQADHNKLFGVSYSLSPKKNSARFAWRFDPVKNRFILSAFCHINGQMIMQDICEAFATKQYDCFLTINSDAYCFRVTFSQTGSVIGNARIPKQGNKRIGFLLGPYFGGNRTAPQKMSLTLKKIK